MSDQPSRKQRYLLFAIVVVLSVVLDLWTKAWAWDTIRPPDGKAIEVIEDIFFFRYGFNTGAAFSFLRDSPYARPFFIIVTVIALGVMLNMIRTMPTKRGYGFLAMGLMVGGALGNLADRLTRLDTVWRDGKLQESYGVVEIGRAHV